MGMALVGNNFSPNPSSKNFILHGKKKVCHGPKFTAFLTLELSQYRKSDSTFSSSKPVSVRSDCRRLGNTLCLCSPVLPTQAVQESGPESSAIDFAVETFDCLLTSVQLVVKVLSAQKSLNKLYGVWILSRSVENAKIEDSCDLIPALMMIMMGLTMP